jgi:pyridoxine 4-dehydrogenase
LVVAETSLLGGHEVRRMGFGAMQLPGPGVFGPPTDRDQALAVLRRAVDSGVNHIDTAQFYGPDVANELIREALHPYPEDLVLVSKVGARRDAGGGWQSAQAPGELRAGVMANLRSLGLEQIHVVNLRRHPESDVPIDEQVDTMAELRDEGHIGAIGLSNVTSAEYSRIRATIDIACVQNAYNVSHRSDQELFHACQADGVPYVPFFPLGSAFSEVNPVLEAPAVVKTARRLGITPAQVALAWLLASAPTVLLIPGTSSLVHLEENLSAGRLQLDDKALEVLELVDGDNGADPIDEEAPTE